MTWVNSPGYKAHCKAVEYANLQFQVAYNEPFNFEEHRNTSKYETWLKHYTAKLRELGY